MKIDFTSTNVFELDGRHYTLPPKDYAFLMELWDAAAKNDWTAIKAAYGKQYHWKLNHLQKMFDREKVPLKVESIKTSQVVDTTVHTVRAK